MLLHQKLGAYASTCFQSLLLPKHIWTIASCNDTRSGRTACHSSLLIAVCLNCRVLPILEDTWAAHGAHDWLLLLSCATIWTKDHLVVTLVFILTILMVIEIIRATRLRMRSHLIQNTWVWCLICSVLVGWYVALSRWGPGRRRWHVPVEGRPRPCC